MSSVFWGLQLHNGELENKNRDLTNRNLVLEAEKCEIAKKLKAATSKKAKSPPMKAQAGAGAQADEGGEAGAAGQGKGVPRTKEMNAFQCSKLFVCTGELWLRPSFHSLFSPPLEKPLMAHDDLKCYDLVTPQLTLMATWADLYHLIPERLHKTMGSRILFQSECGMKDGKSTFISSICHQMPALLGLSPDYFTVENTERRWSPKIVKYLKFNLNNAVYPSLPPIIFLDLHYDVKQMFRNEILIKALGVVLKSNSFITGSKQGTPNTNSQLWNMSTISASMIASTAMMVVHLLSPGRKFAENNTVIDLYKTHQLFKQLLITGQDNRHIKDTIVMYQQAIFNNSADMEHILLELDGERTASIASDVLRALWDDTSVDASVAAVPLPVAAEPAPPATLLRPVPRHTPPEAITVDESSSDESSESESSLSGSSKSSSDEGEEVEGGKEDNEDDDEHEHELKENEAIPDLDEDVGGTDYEDVYINPVSAPISTGQGHCNPAIEPAHISTPIAPLLAPAPALHVLLAPSRASPMHNPVFAIVPIVLAPTVIVHETINDLGHGKRKKQWKDKEGESRANRADPEPSILVVGPAIVNNGGVVARRLRMRVPATTVQVASSPERPSQPPVSKEKKKVTRVKEKKGAQVKKTPK